VKVNDGVYYDDKDYGVVCDEEGNDEEILDDGEEMENDVLVEEEHNNDYLYKIVNYEYVLVQN
jgi:hypothetical protein